MVNLTWDFSRCGMAVLVIVNADLTLTFMDLSNCSSVVVRMSPLSMMPALFTTLSSPEVSVDMRLSIRGPIVLSFLTLVQGSHSTAFLELTAVWSLSFAAHAEMNNFWALGTIE